MISLQEIRLAKIDAGNELTLYGEIQLDDSRSMNRSSSPSPASIPLEIDCRQVRDLLDRGEPFLFIDCREPQEREFCSLGGELIPMGALESRIPWIAEQQPERIIVYCHRGHRSLAVANYLRQKGFAQAQSMRGGIDTWSREIDPRIPRY